MLIFKNINNTPVLTTACGLQVMFDNYTLLGNSQVLILKLKGNVVASVKYPDSLKAFQLILDTLTTN